METDHRSQENGKGLGPPLLSKWYIFFFMREVSIYSLFFISGVHISKVRSVNLDSWTPVQVSVSSSSVFVV